MFNTKKAFITNSNWVEWISFTVLIIGFILSLTTRSAVINYIVITFAGAFFGRIWYKQRTNLRLMWVFIMVGFLFGYLLGNVYGSKKITLIFFIIGIFVSYYIHEARVFKDA